jgi:hypothetical protein
MSALPSSKEDPPEKPIHKLDILLNNNEELDWFERLAQIMECHVEMVDKLDEANRLSFVRRIKKQCQRSLLREPLSCQLRNYDELTCDPQFPISLIKLFWPEFLALLARNIEPRSGLRFKKDYQMVQVTENWVNSATEKPQWIHTKPLNGLNNVIKELEGAKSKVSKSNDPLLAQGAVIYGYTAFEKVLYQIFSFYGRFLYGVIGKSYRYMVSEQYDADEKEKSPEKWARMLPELEKSYERILDQMEDASSEKREVALKKFVGYVLSKKWPLSYSTRKEARDLRKLKESEPNFGFAIRIELLRQLDEWIVSNKFDNLDRFEDIFGRRRLFTEELNFTEEALEVLKMKEEDLTIYYSIESKPSNEPYVIQELKSLNELRKYYAHRRSQKFISPSNSQNLRNGSLKIISAMIDLLKRLSEGVFPEVIMPRRFIQVESNWMRMDYIREGNPDRLHTIRIYQSAFDHLKDIKGIPGALLNHESYLFYRRTDDWLAKSFCILPVNEEFIDNLTRM